MPSYTVLVHAKVDASDIQSQLGGPYQIQVNPVVNTASIASQLSGIQGSVTGAAKTAVSEMSAIERGAAMDALSAFGNTAAGKKAILRATTQEAIELSRRQTQAEKAEQQRQLQQEKSANRLILEDKKLSNAKELADHKAKIAEEKRLKIAADKETQRTAREARQIENKFGTNTGVKYERGWQTKNDLYGQMYGLLGNDFGNAQIKSIGTVNTARDTWEKFAAQVNTADGAIRNVQFAVRGTTGEIYKLDGGIKDTSKTVKGVARDTQLAVSSYQRNASGGVIGNGLGASSYQGNSSTASGMGMSAAYVPSGEDLYGDVLGSDKFQNWQYDRRTKMIKNTGEVLKGATEGLKDFVAVPILGAAAASVAAFAQYETAFTGVRKTVDGSDEELQTLSDDLEEMALRVPVASTQLAGIAQTAGQLGVKTANIADFTEAFAALNVATNLQGEEGAATLARFMNVMGEDMDNIWNAGSAITDLGNNFATTEAEIVTMASRMGKTGSIIGMSTADVLGYSAALSSLGIQAEMGGSAMTRIWTDMATTVSAGGEKLEKFAQLSGKSASDFAKQWQEDPTEAFNSFIKGLSESEDVIQTLNDLGFANVRDVQALQALSSRYDLLTDAISRSNKAYEENTALQNEADKAYNTTTNKLKMAGEAIVQAGRDIGASLAPTVVDYANKVKDAAVGFSELDEAQQKNIVSGGLWTAGTILGVNALGRTLENVAKIRNALKGLQGFFGTAGLAGKLGMTGAQFGTVGLGAAAAATAVVLLAKAYKNYKDEQERALRNFGTDFTDDVEDFKQSIQTYDDVNSKLKEYNSLRQQTQTGALTGDEQVAALERQKELQGWLVDNYGVYISQQERANGLTAETIRLIEQKNELEYRTQEEGLRSDLLGYRENYETNEGIIDDYSWKYAQAEADAKEAALRADRIQNFANDVAEIHRLQEEGEISRKEMNEMLSELKSNYEGPLSELTYGMESSATTDEKKLEQILNNARNAEQIQTDKLQQLTDEYANATTQQQKAKVAAEELARTYMRDMPEALEKGGTAVESLKDKIISSTKGFGADDEISRYLASAVNGFESFDDVLNAHFNGNNVALANTVEDYKKIAQQMGMSATDTAAGMAKMQTGFVEFDDILAKSSTDGGKTLSAFVDNYKANAKELGVSTEEIVKQAALFKQGFEDMSDLYAASEQGKSNTIKDIVSEGLAEGLNADQITDIAQSMDLIPENKTIKINAETSGFEVVDDLTDKINQWGEGLIATISVDASDGMSEAENYLDEFGEHAHVELKFDADGTPVLAEIEGIEHKVTDINKETGKITLTAEDGTQFVLDTVNSTLSEIDGKEATAKVNAEAEGTEQIQQVLAEVQQADGTTATISINVENADGATESQLETLKNTALELQGIGGVEFSVNADTGNLEILNEAQEMLGVIRENGSIDLAINYTENGTPEDIKQKIAALEQLGEELGIEVKVSYKTEGTDGPGLTAEAAELDDLPEQEVEQPVKVNTVVEEGESLEEGDFPETDVDLPEQEAEQKVKVNTVVEQGDGIDSSDVPETDVDLPEQEVEQPVKVNISIEQGGGIDESDIPQISISLPEQEVEQKVTVKTVFESSREMFDSSFATAMQDTSVEITGTINYKAGTVEKPDVSAIEATINYKAGTIEQPTATDINGTINYTVGTVAEPPNTTVNGVVNYSLGSTPSSVPAISGVANYTLGSVPTSAPAISGVANYSGVFPSSAPTLYGTVVYTAVIQGAPNATGTDNFEGGMAYVNDQKGVQDPRELIVEDGRAFIPQGRDVLIPLSKGTKIYTAAQTKRIMNNFGVKNYADGRIPNSMYDTYDLGEYTMPTTVGAAALYEKINGENFNDPTSAIVNRIMLTSKLNEKELERLDTLKETAKSETAYSVALKLTDKEIELTQAQINNLQTANEELFASLDALSDKGYDISGWVDPMGELTEEYYNTLNGAGEEEQKVIQNIGSAAQSMMQQYIENQDEMFDLTQELIEKQRELGEIMLANQEKLEAQMDRDRLRDDQMIERTLVGSEDNDQYYADKVARYEEEMRTAHEMAEWYRSDEGGGYTDDHPLIIDQKEKWWAASDGRDQTIQDYYDDKIDYNNRKVEQLEVWRDYYDEEDPEYQRITEEIDMYLTKNKMLAEEAANVFRNLGYSESSDFVRHFQEQYESAEKTITSHIKERIELRKQEFEEQEESLQEILDLTVELIKKEKQDEIDAIEEKVDKYKELIDLKKNELSLAKQQRDYESSIKDKNRELSKYQDELFQLSLDNSGDMAIESRKKELAEKIAEIQDEIAEEQSDRYIELMEQAYDEDYENYEKKQQEKVDKLQEELDESGMLVQEAISRIETEGTALYDELINYNSIYGTGIDSDVTKNWEKATAALEKYKNALDEWDVRYALEHMNSGSDEDIEEMVRSDMAAEILSEMQQNSKDWHYSSAEDKKNLEVENETLKNVLEYLTGKGIYKQDGRWYEVGTNIPIYHDGIEKGFVGDKTYNPMQEQYAKLMNGELVVNPAQQTAFMERILPKYTQGILDRAGGSVVLDMNGMTMMSVGSMSITKDSVKDVQKVLDSAQKTLTQNVLRAMNDGMLKRGIKSSASSMMRRSL